MLDLIDCDVEDLEKLIAKTKRKLSKSAKPFNDKKSLNELFNALDEGMEIVSRKPDITKSLIFSNKFQSAYAEINDAYNAEIKGIQAYINAVNLIYSFLKSIQLPEGSKAKPLQDKIANEHEEFAKYNTDVIESIAAKNPNVKTVKTEY